MRATGTLAATGPIMNRRIAILTVAGCLAGCAATEATTTTIAKSINLTAADAALLFGIVKGIAEVAELAVPSLAPVIALALAAMAPGMAAITAGLAAAADISSVVTQSTALLIAVAPKIQVVASAT